MYVSRGLRLPSRPNSHSEPLLQTSDTLQRLPPVPPSTSDLSLQPPECQDPPSTDAPMWAHGCDPRASRMLVLRSLRASSTSRSSASSLTQLLLRSLSSSEKLASKRSPMCVRLLFRLLKSSRKHELTTNLYYQGEFRRDYFRMYLSQQKRNLP